MNALKQLEACGQAPWLDFLLRSFTAKGGLKAMIERDGLKGVTCDDPHDIDVPGQGYSFGVAKAAQARGDLEVLVERGRRAPRVHLNHVDEGLADLARAITSALD